jgi:hypothetical protein
MCRRVKFSGLNGVVVSVADCYPKGAGFDSRVMLGIFPFRKRGLRTLVWQTNLGKEANLSRNPEREGPNSTGLLSQYLLFFLVGWNLQISNSANRQVLYGVRRRKRLAWNFSKIVWNKNIRFEPKIRHLAQSYFSCDTLTLGCATLKKSVENWLRSSGIWKIRYPIEPMQNFRSIGGHLDSAAGLQRMLSKLVIRSLDTIRLLVNRKKLIITYK